MYFMSRFIIWYQASLIAEITSPSHQTNITGIQVHAVQCIDMTSLLIRADITTKIPDWVW